MPEQQTDQPMTDFYKNIIIAVMGIVITSLLGWIAWVSMHLASLPALSDRVERIAESLPDQVRIAADEYLETEFRTALIADNKTEEKNGSLARKLFLVDSRRGKAQELYVPVASQTDDGGLARALIQLHAQDHTARSVAQLASFARQRENADNFNAGDCNASQSVVFRNINTEKVISILQARLDRLPSTKQLDQRTNISKYREVVYRLNTFCSPDMTKE